MAQKRVIYFLVCVVFIVAGIVMTVRGKAVVGNAKASVSWPSVYGKIVQSDVTQKRSHTNRKNRRPKIVYHADVSFQYRVDGSRYTSDVVSFGQYGSNKPEHARHIVGRYPVGKEVEVFYSPEDPGVAVLEPGTSKSSYITLMLGIVFSATGGLLFVGGILRLR